jgi:hypothetical protein
MNDNLQKEIVKHIFNQLGILECEMRISLVEKMTDEKFLVDKKMAFEANNTQYKNNVWAAEGKLAANTVKILVADIKEDIDEYAMIFQMDSLPVYALRYSLDEDDKGSIYFCNEGRWIASDVAIQSKFLYGIEAMASTLFIWNKLGNYMELYKYLITFLNYYATVDE